MIKLFVILLAVGLLSSCASEMKSERVTPAAPKADSPAESQKPAQQLAIPPTDGRPACLNVIENDLRVEFTGRKLLLTETGKPKALELNRGLRVDCEVLNVMTDVPEPKVVITYQTEQRGTSVLVSDRMMGIASIRSGKWLVEPFIVERLLSRADGEEKVPFHDVKWTVESGKAVFTWTNLETKKTQTFRP